MKHRFFSSLISVLALFLYAGLSAEAQPNPGVDWKEKMQSGKIAFLTMEIGLTPAEAQNFWPINNTINDELDKAMYETVRSYMELEKALDGKKSDKEISKYLENYLDAMELQNKIKSESVEKYRKILPDNKVAKIFVAEEKFRRQHIRMLQHNPGRPNQANR